MVLGDKHRFAAEVGECERALRRVDLWAAGKWLTCDDNMVFVSQFRLAVVDTAAWLRAGEGSPLPFNDLSPEATHRRLMHRAGADDETEAEYELRSQFRGMTWGPTADNVAVHIFRDGDNLVLTVQFCREKHVIKHPERAGEVFVVEIPTVEFLGFLRTLWLPWPVTRSAADDRLMRHRAPNCPVSLITS